MSTLTITQIQTYLSNLYSALANDELEVEDADGYKVKFKSNRELNLAITKFEALKSKASGRRGMAFKVSGGKGL